MSSQDSHYAQFTGPDSGPVDTPVGTARIGAELRQVREQGGWKLAEVAAALRIREPYLDAIEHGDLEALPGPAYQIGFVRSYANALGPDGEEILRRFRAEGVGAVKKPELSFLAPVPDRAVPSGAIVLVGVVLLLAGYGFWFLHTENDRTLAASVPAVPAQLAPLAVPPALAAKSSVLAAGQPSHPVQEAATGTAFTSAAAASLPGTPAPGAGTALVAPGVLAGQPQPKPVVAGAGKVIVATADSWVEVKDASGTILFSRVMHSGDTWPVPDMPGLTMTAGNAGGTEIADNGIPGQPLGAPGAVVRNHALTPAGTAPASPALGTTASTNSVSNAAKGTN